MEASVKTRRVDGEETRARLKAVAQRLFALRGLAGVSVQDIVSEAGQRNNASLRYYFGTKTELARELIVDGAQLLDEHRQAMVDALEREGRAKDMRAILKAFSEPVLRLREQPGQTHYIRMIANFQLHDRAFLRECLADTWNVGYKRCAAHLMNLMPNVPDELKEQRISLTGIYGNALWAARELALESNRPGKLWACEATIANALDTMQLMLEGSPSGETLGQLSHAGRAEEDRSN